MRPAQCADRRELPHIRLGNKALVKSMKFKRLRRHGCGSTDVRLYNAYTMDEAQ